MRKLSKKIVSVVLALVTVFTTLAATATTAFAANYSTSYSSYNEPESNDYAYWNGKSNSFCSDEKIRAYADYRMSLHDVFYTNDE